MEIINYGAAATNQAVFFYVGTDNKIHCDLYTSSLAVTSSATVTDGNWHLVGVVNNAGSFQIYIDGAASGSPQNGSPNINSGFQTIGSYSGGYFFNGAMDEVRFYNVALSSAQVTQLYQTPPFAYYLYFTPAATYDDGVSASYTAKVNVTAQSTTNTFSLNSATNPIYHLDVNPSIVLPTTVIPSGDPAQIVTSPTQISWNSSAFTNRVYAFMPAITSTTDGATYNIQLHDPNTGVPAESYTFSITSFVSDVTNAYVEVTNPQNQITEIKPLSPNIDFTMQQYQTYTITFTCTQGSFSEQFTAGNTLANSLQILAGSFSNSNVTVPTCNVERATATEIIISYQDPSLSTTALTVTITHQYGTATILDYTLTSSGSSQIIMWSSADSQTSYTVTVNATITSTNSTYGSNPSWTFAIGATVPSNPWLGVFDFLGQNIQTMPQIYTGWPNGFTSFDIAQLIGAFIIILFLGMGSLRNTGASMIMACIAAGIMFAIGWWGGGMAQGAVAALPELGFAFFVATLTHFSEKKAEGAGLS